MVFVGFFLFLRGFAAMVALCAPVSGFAAEAPVQVPQFINPNTVTTVGSTVNVRTIRFLTTDDFPPFNFIDQEGRLEGFNVALARELCIEIKVRCTMQAVPWGNLRGALETGHGDAIVAGLAQSDETIRDYAFSAPYLRLPARFFVPAAREKAHADFKGPGAEKVGVEAGSAHEAFLKMFFPETPREAFKDQEALRQAVRDGRVPLGFADGMTTSFWLQSSAAADCCVFTGGPYLNSDYFGPGLSIAVPIDRIDLKQVIDDGLGRIMRKGKYAEIYLRYFPVSFF